MLFRFLRNCFVRGRASVCEPIFEDGALIGVLNFVTGYFVLPNRQMSEIELIEVVRMDDPPRQRCCIAAGAPKRRRRRHGRQVGRRDWHRARTDILALRLAREPADHPTRIA